MQDVIEKIKKLLCSNKAQMGGPWGFVVMGMIGLLISVLVGAYIVIPLLQNATTDAGITGTAATIIDHTPTMVALGIFMLSVLLIGVGGWNIFQSRTK